MIDLHCHLDLYPDPPSVIERVIAEGHYVLAVTTTPRAWAGTRSLTSHAPKIQVAIGLHPELVTQRYAEVELLCSMISEAKYVGEIGLDGSPAHKGSLNLQQQALDQILRRCEEHGGRIMTIHSRGAASSVLDALEAHPKAGKPILHWFSGTSRELKRAIEMGCWFSIGPAMLRAQKGISLVQLMPRNRILTETDGPFTMRDNNSMMPWDVRDAVTQLAQLWCKLPVEVEETLNTNLKMLLKN